LALRSGIWGNGHVVKVEFRMGRKYARAVKLCLGVEKSDGETMADGLRTRAQEDRTLDVLDAVVTELRECIV
jgi:hypothetical protein